MPFISQELADRIDSALIDTQCDLHSQCLRDWDVLTDHVIIEGHYGYDERMKRGNESLYNLAGELGKLSNELAEESAITPKIWAFFTHTKPYSDAETTNFECFWMTMPTPEQLMKCDALQFLNMFDEVERQEFLGRMQIGAPSFHEGVEYVLTQMSAET